MDSHSQHNDENHIEKNNHDAHDQHQQEHHGETRKGHGVDHSGHEEMFRRRFWVSLILSLPVLIFSKAVQGWVGFTTPIFPSSNWIVPVISVVIFGYGGIPFIKMAIPEVKHRSPGMMSLITLAIIVAFIYSIASTIFQFGESFYWELVTLIDVMLLGHWIEMRSVRQASGSLNELAKLLPDTAERITGEGSTEKVLVDQLLPGDMILIRPGVSIPADGIVVDGESHLNESMITGESNLVSKTVDDQLIAGTINDEGSLRVIVSATGDDTALAGIMRLVKEAQQSKSKTQLLADNAAGWLFYIALLVALFTGIGWVIAVGFDIEVVKRVVTVLVIACPHALGLAVPLVVAISTSIGAKNGILIRDRIALEDARLVETIIFDKTGTLTKGEFGVADISAIDGWTVEQVVGIAAALEKDSEHLIARAIQRKAQESDISIPETSGFLAIKGRGVKARVNDREAYIGGPNLLSILEIQLTGKLADFSRLSGDKGQSVVYLVLDGKAVAAFSLADIIRNESVEAINQLRGMGIDVVMLTGDSKEVAKSVAAELGIMRYYAEVLPEEKDQKIIELQNEGKRVAMVGDGVNDAPALTRADVGIAIGSGTDVAVESAGIILVKNNPLDIVQIIKLSRATYNKMIQNLIWATGYNIIAIPLAAGVLAPFGILLSPAIGALFMSLSTVIVALNAQLLRRGAL